MEERLQKIIARAGIASRRKAEELILQGRVTVNGTLVTKLGSKADPERDHIKVDGRRLRSSHPALVYLMLNKPKGVITSTRDPQGRATVQDLLGRYRKSVYPVGRLDYHSEGLLLFTNDGDFANLVLSAKSQIPKTYQVKVNGAPTAEDLERFRNGIKLDGRLTAAAKIRLVKAAKNPWYEVTLTEGRRNQIRRMFQALGLMVEKLKRVRIGPLPLGSLPAGSCRLLTAAEVERFQKLGDKAGAKQPSGPPRAAGKGRGGGRPAHSAARRPRTKSRHRSSGP